MKRFHVSKNLFNENYPNISGSIQYTAMYVGNVIVTMSTTCPRAGNSACLWLLAGDVSSGASGDNNVYSGMSRTATAIDGYITIAYRATGGINPSDYNTILNAGSTALPYEPYGDIWETKSPPKYGTDTDIITRVPVTVIPDGTNASVDIIGNMNQSGTSSPSSPIYPSETGDKTANLFDKTIATIYGAYFNISGVLASSQSSRVVIIPVAPNTTYTITVSEKPAIMRLYETSVQSPNIGITFDVITREASSNTLIFTTGANTANLGLQGTLDTYDIWFNIDIPNKACQNRQDVI